MHVETPSENPIIIMSRVFDAPRELVWVAFTNPEHVSKWYGGHGFENPVCEMDVRKGGLWRHTMRTPDGTNFLMEFVFVEVTRPEKLVWKNRTHPAPPERGLLNVVNTVTLEDGGARTPWKLVAEFDSIADRDQAVKNGFSRVVTQGSEKLNTIVSELSTKRVAS